jgi:hypothetical protein
MRLAFSHQWELTVVPKKPVKVPSSTKEQQTAKDTRGLPDGYDIDRLYRYRYDTLVNNATGLESFLYKIIPYSYVKSFAFAIDPTYKYKVAPDMVTAVNRVRIKATDSVLLQRKRTRTIVQTSWSQLSNYKGIAVCSSPYYVYTTSSNPVQTVALTKQFPIPDRIKDTSVSTRPLGSERGELEFFKSYINSPPRESIYRVDGWRRVSPGAEPDSTCKAVGGTTDFEVGSNETWRTLVTPTAATLSESTFSAFRDKEVSFCDSVSQKLLPNLLLNNMPFKRQYSLARNVAELKDLPRSIAQARQTAVDLKAVYNSLSGSPKLRSKIFDLSNKAAANLPGEYLSYHFGWKQLHKDLSDLTALPEKLSKKLNFLIQRSNKQTTFRKIQESESGESGVSGFVYDTFDHEWEQSHTSRIVRKHKTTLVVNGVFDFPPINNVQLRQRFFADQVGLIPRFIDVYNIIPWTWLIDWFTGLGNYLELIEETNHDPVLVNWGMITTHTSGKLITNLSYINATQEDFYLNNIRVSPTAATNRTLNHTSVLSYECRTRRNVARVPGMEVTSIPDTLTGYRASIIGALLAQRIDNTRSGTFRPRS